MTTTTTTATTTKAQEIKELRRLYKKWHKISEEEGGGDERAIEAMVDFDYHWQDMSESSRTWPVCKMALKVNEHFFDQLPRKMKVRAVSDFSEQVWGYNWEIGESEYGGNWEKCKKFMTKKKFIALFGEDSL